MGFELVFESPNGADVVVIHNDDRTVWAYLHTPAGIASDVWLFNLEAAPDEIQRDRGRPPLNPARYCSPDPPPVIEHRGDVLVEWLYEGADLVSVELVADGRPLARLVPGAKPGWSTFAALDGPCARTLR